ncbi:MAG TPA: DUF4383 domain-containing protein [Bacillales bacterium]|nr:DUF4383 domain-containing protein [Bacillales bacterium]
MAKGFMRIVGIILLIVGIVGFVYSFPSLFKLTVLHNIIHIVTGLIFIAVSGSEARSRTTAKVFGYVYLLVALLGIFVTNLAGLLILEPADTVLHFLIAAASLYVGHKSSSVSHSTKPSV